MEQDPPRIERHEAADRFGKTALRTAHDITRALAPDGTGDGDPVVLRRGGPHRSIDGLAALIDEALAEDEAAASAGGEPADGTTP